MEEVYKSPYNPPEGSDNPRRFNLEYFLEHFEDVCPEDFEGFTQQHFDRIGNMFFRPENPKGAVRLARTKPEKTLRILCECGSTINKSSMKSHIKTKRHLLHQH
jgi:hypothetical protein